MRSQNGKLEVVFAYKDGKTVLRHAYHRTPLQIVRPFEFEPSILTLTIINPTAGIMGGDHFEISIVLEPQAKVILLTQSAGKIHKMHPGEVATQDLKFEIAQQARLEYYPQRLIPFAASNYQQNNQIQLESEAEFLMLETWASGRIAKQERLAFLRYANQTKLHIAGQLEYLERFVLEPLHTDYGAFGLLEANTHSLTGICIGKQKMPFVLPKGVQHGKTQSGHTWVRAFSQDDVLLDKNLQTTRNTLRQAYFGLPELQLRG
ncbi:MAG: urease accessory protein UreD [Deinococcales bacterium]